MGTYIFSKFAEFFPLFEILGSIESDSLGSSQGHNPFVLRSVPKYLRISEVLNTRVRDYRVVGILGEGAPVVQAISDGLRLLLTSRSVEGYNSPFAEACGIVLIYHGTTRKDSA